MFKSLLLLQIFMLCYSLHVLLLNTMLYVTHTLLNMYRLLLRSNVYTNWLGEISTYSTRHIMSKHSPYRGSYGQSQTASSCGSYFSSERSVWH